jgi:hypothetical protein
MPNLFWIWWLFQLFLIFLYEMAYYILGAVILWWVAKVGLSQRHRHNRLTRHRVKNHFRQSFDE